MIREKEFKGMINLETYEKLLAKGWENEILQINFYYTNDKLVNKSDITVRIRCIRDKMLLQIKVREEQNDGIRLSSEYEKKLEFIPDEVSEKDLRDIWKDYKYDNVKLIGFLITDRKIVERNGIEIDIDKNIYEGNIDYEIEFEYKDDKAVIENIIADMELEDSIYQGKGKYERFKNAINNK